MRRAALALDRQCELSGLNKPIAEFRFSERRWKFDWAWPDFKLALEQEGGVWTGGRHTRGKGYEADLEKYNCAVLLGWRVLRFTPRQVQDGSALMVIEGALRQVYLPVQTVNCSGD